MSKHMWHRLNGIFCIYKPSNYNIHHARVAIMGNLVEDLNNNFVPPKESLITIEGSVVNDLNVKISEKLAVHPLAIGEGYVREDISLNFANHLAYQSSGISICGVNKGVKLASAIRHMRLIRTYRLSGVLGFATSTFHISGKVVEKSRFSHVKKHHLERNLMTIQAIHQKRAMDYIGMNTGTQGAFELLSEEGIVRPETDSFPLAYSFRIIEFNPPHFTIELSCINETESFLRKIIHDTGLMLKTNATTTQIRCIQYGPFNLDDALLRKHWRIEHVLGSISALQPKIKFLKNNSNESIKEYNIDAGS